MKLVPITVALVGFLLGACAGAPAASSPTPTLPTATAAPIVTPSTAPTTAPTPSLVASPSTSPTPAPVLFDAPVFVPLPGGLVALGDFNGDGDIDLVSTNSDGTFSLLVGDGAGGFESIDLGPNISPAAGPASSATADFDGNGSLDVAIAFSGVSDMGTGTDDLVLLLQTDGHFKKLVRAARVNAQDITVGDFNDDGKPDLATANESDHVSIFLGLGDGTFADPLSSATGATYSSGISVADFNGDGELDLATANSLIGRGRSNRTVSVLLGQGDGTFGEPLVAQIKDSQPISPEVADLNGDGLPDVVTPNGDPSHEVSVLLGTGNGYLGESIQYRTGADPHSLRLADLDGDGNVDIVTWNSGVRGGLIDRGLSVVFGNGDGTFGPNIDLVAEYDAEIVAVVDFNSDGRPDVVLDGAGQLILLPSVIPQG